MNRLIPIRTNLNLRPHEKTYIATNVRLAEVPFYSAHRCGEARMPMLPWHPPKRTNPVLINKKELIRRATLDPWFFFQLAGVYSGSEINAIEQHEMLHRWAYLLKS